MNLNKTLEKIMENNKNTIEVQIGAFSLVAMKYVTIKIPMPQTALNAENNINERNAGDLDKREKNEELCSPTMTRAVAFPSKYSVLIIHYIGHGDNKPSKQSETAFGACRVRRKPQSDSVVVTVQVA